MQRNVIDKVLSHKITCSVTEAIIYIGPPGQAISNQKWKHISETSMQLIRSVVFIRISKWSMLVFCPIIKRASTMINQDDVIFMYHFTCHSIVFSKGQNSNPNHQGFSSLVLGTGNSIHKSPGTSKACPYHVIIKPKNDKHRPYIDPSMVQY